MKLLLNKNDITEKLIALLRMEGLEVENFEWTFPEEGNCLLTMDFKAVTQTLPSKSTKEVNIDSIVSEVLKKINPKGHIKNNKIFKKTTQEEEEAIKELKAITAQDPISGKLKTRVMGPHESFSFPKMDE